MSKCVGRRRGINDDAALLSVQLVISNKQFNDQRTCLPTAAMVTTNQLIVLAKRAFQLKADQLSNSRAQK